MPWSRHDLHGATGSFERCSGCVSPNVLLSTIHIMSYCLTVRPYVAVRKKAEEASQNCDGHWFMRLFICTKYYWGDGFHKFIVPNPYYFDLDFFSIKLVFHLNEMLPDDDGAIINHVSFVLVKMGADARALIQHSWRDQYLFLNWWWGVQHQQRINSFQSALPVWQTRVFDKRLQYDVEVETYHLEVDRYFQVIL